LLSKAFQGELVSQKSSDEPTSALMERLHSAIKIQNANASKAKRKKEPLPISRLGSVMLKRENVNSNYLSEILRKSGSMSPKNLWSLSQLEIDDFYVQLKEEEENGLLREISQESDGALRLLEVV
jgi:DNA primase large subunit